MNLALGLPMPSGMHTTAGRRHTALIIFLCWLSIGGTGVVGLRKGSRQTLGVGLHLQERHLPCKLLDMMPANFRVVNSDENSQIRRNGEVEKEEIPDNTDDSEDYVDYPDHWFSDSEFESSRSQGTSLSEELTSDCPALYRRYSRRHSYCRPPNASCSVLRFGVSRDQDIRTILKTHNELRNKIALGREIINNFPPAANMMQMEWDDELMAVSEKHISQCVFEHDCSSCRQVENFPVGQNLYTLYSTQESRGTVKPNWDKAIRAWYNEVAQAPRSIVRQFGDGYGKIGHFTQVIWAETWKVGCAYLALRPRESVVWKVQELYFCNYGPSGNVLGHPIYEIGETCSKCPLNTCCDERCARQRTVADFKGLCSAYRTVVVIGGHSAKMKFMKVVQPKKGFCLRFKYRKGPDVAGTESKNTFQIVLHFPDRGDSVVSKPNRDSTDFVSYNLNGIWASKTEINFEFLVPSNKPAQYLDIAEVRVTDDPRCDPES